MISRVPFCFLYWYMPCYKENKFCWICSFHCKSIEITSIKKDQTVAKKQKL